MAEILIGNIKGPKGDTGDTGATGATGDAATIQVGTVSTTAYGQPAQVTNSGTSGAAVFDFVIPEGRPGDGLTDMSDMTNNTVTPSTSSYPIPSAGDTGRVLWGKVQKFFADIKSAVESKLNSDNVVNNFTTTDSGYALDARAGKELNDKIVYGRFYRNDATMADFKAWCATLDNAIPYPVYFGQSLCYLLTGISGTFLVGTLVLTNSKGAARMLVGNGVAGIKSQVFSITVNLQTDVITLSRLISDDAIDGVGSAATGATDVISVSTALTANTFKTLASLTLDRGVYYFEGYVRFVSVPANTRLMWIVGGTATPSMSTQGVVTEYVGTAATGQMGKTVTRVMRIANDNSTIYFAVAANAACNVDVSRLNATKIAIYQQ